MKKLITFLYRKITKPEVKTIFLKIQRNFEFPVLTDKEAQERNLAVSSFIKTGWFDRILNEHLKEYVESLFNLCETEEQRNRVQEYIHVLLKFEDKMKSYNVQEPDEKFDPNDL